MKISEAIHALERKKDQYGDIPFCFFDDYVDGWAEVRAFELNEIHLEGRYEIEAQPGEKFLSILAYVPGDSRLARVNRWKQFTPPELKSILDAYTNVDREWSMIRGDCPIEDEVREELEKRRSPELTSEKWMNILREGDEG